MKKTLKSFISLFFIIVIAGCEKPCEKDLRIGEIVQIPIQFNGFSLTEIDNILVFRIDDSDTNSIDTFLMQDILWANMARSTNEIITDKEYSKAQKQYGYYDSYLDNCTLIFNWNSGRDTLSNFEIKKSQEKIDGCHENDPNVKIDKLSFIHKGKTISKNESIQITK